MLFLFFVIFLQNHSFHFLQRISAFLHRTDDHHAGGFHISSRLHFICKPAGCPGFLRYQKICFCLPQHRRIQFPRKRSLHADQLFFLQSDALCHCKCLFLRKHSCIQTLLICDLCRKLRQFLQPCGQKDISLLCLQPIRRFLTGFYGYDVIIC